MTLFTHKHTGNTMEIPDHNVAAYLAAGWVRSERRGGRVREVAPVVEVVEPDESPTV